MTHSQYMRKVTLIVGNDEEAIDLSELHIVFSVRHADKENPQSAVVRVYNLSTKTLQAIQIKEFTRLLLQAGYQDGAFGAIFDGDIVQARIGRESAVDTYAEFIAAEGYAAHSEIINQTLAAGATMADTANAAASAMGASIEANSFDADFKLPRGQVLYGMARDALREATARAGQTYFYERGKVITLPLQGYRPGTVSVVSAETGMIGWPVQTQAGIEVKTLLNPAFAVGGRIQLNNESIQLAQFGTNIQSGPQNLNYPGLDPSGVYRILTLDYSGDTRGNTWYTSIIGLALDQSAGGISSLIQAGIG